MKRSRQSLFGGKQQLRRNRRMSPLMLVGGLVTMIVVVLAGGVIFLLPHLQSHAAGADPDMNCTLIVPALPLTAQGLATPYQLTATQPADGPCNESNLAQSAFVQGVIYDPARGTFGVYNPLVIDKGARPAVQPTAPKLPTGAVVGVWFGFNADNLLLQGAQGDTLAQAHCVNGLGQSLFTQFAYCNARAFFAAVNQGIASGKVKIPALGRAKDGQTCPTVRDFSVVDQDQSDNVQTQYLSRADGQMAQLTAANQAKLPKATIISNPSDNRLLTDFVDPTLGCQPWRAPDLADNGNPVSSLALDEIQAAADQRAPIALIPLNNPMTTVGENNRPSLEKTNLYRLGVDQIPAATAQQADGTAYCKNLVQTGIPRLQLDKLLTIAGTSPDPAAANDLFTFLAQRFQASYTNLNCRPLLHMPNPVTTQTNAEGVVISATFKVNDPSTATNCAVNGTVLAGCNGTASINGISCTFTFDKEANQVRITCPGVNP
jgi:hypothetical protein